MGLYKNHEMHPTVFLKNNVASTNQEYYKWEYMAEWMLQQTETNEEFEENLKYITKLHRKLNARQRGEAMMVDEKLEMLQEASEENKEIGRQAMEGHAMLDVRTQDMAYLLEGHQQSSADISEKLEILTKANDNITEQLVENEAAREALAEQMNNLASLQQELSEQIASSKSYQENVLEKLEGHEALLEKLTRQMNQLRSIIYERVHFLREKVEDGYELTSTYMYHLMNGGDQPFTIHLKSKEKETENKES